MRKPQKPFSILKMHNHGEKCWGVVDSAGALVDRNGLSIRMTKDEASELAARWNVEETDLGEIRLRAEGC